MKRIGFIDGRRVAGWSFPATATPGNGQVVDITDPSAGAVSSVTGSVLKFRPTGDKTGTPYVTARQIELYPQGDAGYLSAHGIYVATPVGSPTLQTLWGQDIYMAALGALATVGEFCGISIGMDASNAATQFNAFLRCYVHGSAVLDSVILLPSSRGTTNFARFHHMVEPVIAGAVGGNQTYRIRVRIAATSYYIPLHTA